MAVSGGEQQERMRDDADRRVLTPAFRGQRALGGLDGLYADAIAPRLELDASSLTGADAFTGVVVHEAAQRHLDADSGYDVVLREPQDEQTYDVLGNLVGDLPRRARWAGDQARAFQRERNVLLPAMPIDNKVDAELITKEWMPAVTASLRIQDTPRRLLLMATAVFADNGVKHAPSLLCACYDQQANDLQLVSLSSFLDPIEADDPARVLERMWAQSDRNAGGIATLIEQAGRRGVEATVRLAIGSGRLRWRGQAAPVIRADAAAVPAFAASLEIHLPART